MGFSASPVVAARATPVRQAPSQVDFTKSAKKSAEKIRPDLQSRCGVSIQALKRGQVIDPTAHIYIYIHIYLSI